MQKDKYFHWIWGENKLREDSPEYLINLEIGVSIRFDSSLAMFASFEEFYKEIADVQFIYERPSDAQVERVLIEAWNYLALEEQKLDES